MGGGWLFCVLVVFCLVLDLEDFVLLEVCWFCMFGVFFVLWEFFVGFVVVCFLHSLLFLRNISISLFWSHLTAELELQK